MVRRRFDDYIATVYSQEETMVKGSRVKAQTIVYENIKCSLWRSRATSSPTGLEVQTEKNQYELNFDSWRTLLAIGQTIEVQWMGKYRIIDVVKHTRANGIIDNYQVIAQKTTNDTN